MKSVLNNKSELQLRLIAGILGGSLMIAGIVFSEWSYFIVFFTISLLTLLEFYKLLGLDGNLPHKAAGIVNGMFLFVLTYFIEKNSIDSKYYFLAFLGFSFIYLIKLYNKHDPKPFTNIGFTFLGIAYVALPFALLNFVIFTDGEYHYEIVVGSLFILWASDTGAYFTGKKFGRKKLFERISPKKTWEGSIGGTILALGVAYGFSLYFDYLSHWEWIVIALLIVVSGTYGDLVESLFKRSMSIKDSGKTIPGHGGFLDRFDGLLLAAPFIVAFIKLTH